MVLHYLAGSHQDYIAKKFCISLNNTNQFIVLSMYQPSPLYFQTNNLSRFCLMIYLVCCLTTTLYFYPGMKESHCNFSLSRRNDFILNGEIRQSKIVFCLFEMYKQILLLQCRPISHFTITSLISITLMHHPILYTVR